MVEILKATSAHHSAIQEIFWETSARSDFETPLERQEFLERYLLLYTRDYPEQVLVAVENNEVLGYILGVPDTKAASKILSANAHLELFEELYERYPAHLHINFRSKARGRGLGSLLIQAFEEHLRGQGVNGLHLITSATARNVGFYLKNGFAHKVEKLWNGRPILFLGKKLPG